jgi:hypothetical protein
LKELENFDPRNPMLQQAYDQDIQTPLDLEEREKVRYLKKVIEDKNHEIEKLR